MSESATPKWSFTRQTDSTALHAATRAKIRPRRFRACSLLVRLTPRQLGALREIDPDLSLPELVSMVLDTLFDDVPDIDDPVPFHLPENN